MVVDELGVLGAGDEFMKSLIGGHLRIMDALPYMDPPEHTEIKFITNDCFPPTQLQKWTDQIRGLALASIEKLEKLSSERGEIDLRDGWALGFPLRDMMTLFGVPHVAARRLRRKRDRPASG